MHSTNITLACLLAALLWTAGFTLVVLSMCVPADIGHLGVAFIASGAMIQIRGYYIDLQRRERNAFEIGRDVERRRNLVAVD